MLFVLFLFCFVFRQLGTSDLCPLIRDWTEPMPPAVEAQSLDHWTVSEPPDTGFINVVTSPYNSSRAEALVFQPFHDTEGRGPRGSSSDTKRVTVTAQTRDQLPENLRLTLKKSCVVPPLHHTITGPLDPGPHLCLLPASQGLMGSFASEFPSMFYFFQRLPTVRYSPQRRTLSPCKLERGEKERRKWTPQDTDCLLRPIIRILF